MQTAGLGGNSYLEDLHRTYKALPTRNNATFEKAMQFREREKAQLDAVVQENEDLRTSLAEYKRLATESTTLLKSQRESIDSLKSKLTTNGASASRSDRRFGDDGVPPLQKSVNEASEGSSLQRKVLPTDIHGARRQGTEHADEGRPTSYDRVSEQPTGGHVQAK